MVGSVAANLHDGSRSEYLAQYIFASFGTSVAVPHQEDSGIDLYCTLTERVGQRAWPRAYYSVQVKSSMDPWVLQSEESIRWLIEHPLPLLLCIVDKAAASIRVYQTSPRFYVWAILRRPSRLELVPGTQAEGECTQWTGSTTFSLSAPILQASVEDLLHDELHARAKEVLGFWIGVDLENLFRMRAGVHSFTMPGDYRTNDTKCRGWVTQFITHAPSLDHAIARLKEPLAWLASQLHRRKDIRGAIRCALVLRYLFPQDLQGGTHNAHLHNEINRLMRSDPSYLYSGSDALDRLIDETCGLVADQCGGGDEQGNAG